MVPLIAVILMGWLYISIGAPAVFTVVVASLVLADAKIYFQERF